MLILVLAACMNNTDISTCLGWYSSSVSAGTSDLSFLQEPSAEHKADGGWNEATPFAIIQGTDNCELIVALCEGGDTSFIRKRVLLRACVRTLGFASMENVWMASDFDGAFV